MFVSHEIHVRGVKLIENRYWVGNVGEIVPEHHLRFLEKGPKIVAKTVPGRPHTMEQSTAHRPVDAPSKDVIVEGLTMGEEGSLVRLLYLPTVASDGPSWW